MDSFNSILNAIENSAQNMDIAKTGTLVSHNPDNTVTVFLDDLTMTIPLITHTIGKYSIQCKLEAGTSVTILALDTGVGGERNLNNAVCLGATGGVVDPDKLIISGESVSITLESDTISIDAPNININGSAKLNGRDIKTE